MRDLTSAILSTPPGRSTRHASRTKSETFVPMSERQKIATSTDSSSRGTCAMSHAVTRSLAATRSNEWTRCLASAATRASPQPKSATTSEVFCPRSQPTIRSTGFCGHLRT
eukprot:Amastigsp_a181803_6.p4 type:complete len:111 gc:universal Amastigsp_a181803_6:196-528(+)